MWNYSVETTTLVSEITVHTRNVVVPGATASLKTRHIHQEPVNLTWYGKKSLCRCSQAERRSQGISTGPHWTIGVPTGDIWTDTQGEGHTEREAETGVLLQSHPSNSKDRGQPPEVRTDSRDRSPSEPSGAHTADTRIFTDRLHNRDKVHIRCFQLHSLWHIITTALGN